MARPFSIDNLAHLIVVEGYDTASAAEYFSVKVSFIENEQKKAAYKRAFNRFSRQYRNEDRNEDGKDGKDAPVNFYKVKPFYRGVHGKFYRGIRAFPEYRVKPFYRGVHGGFHRGVSGTETEKREQDTKDILALFDGVPELVADYMWEKIMDRVPSPTQLRTESETYNLIQTRIQGYVQGYTQAFTQGEKTKLAGIEPNATADQTALEIIAILMALPVGSRLPINWFDGNLNIPTNTASWHGAFQLNTAYTSGSIVTDGGNVFIYIKDVPETNTTRPGADTARAEHLDVGSPLDLTNVGKSGLTFTFTRRNGSSVTLTITSADILTAIQNMSASQKSSLRTTIGAQQAGVIPTHSHSGFASSSHTHDSRYFTESQSDDRYARKDHSHSNSGFTEAQARKLFSLLGHTHSGYASSGHTHSGYALKDHTHPNSGGGLTFTPYDTTVYKSPQRMSVSSVRTWISGRMMVGEFFVSDVGHVLMTNPFNIHFLTTNSVIIVVEKSSYISQIQLSYNTQVGGSLNLRIDFTQNGTHRFAVIVI